MFQNKYIVASQISQTEVGNRNHTIMKFPSILAGIAVALCPANAAPIEERAAGVQGFDISNWQHNVDFSGAYKSGARFVIIKVRKSKNAWRM